MKLGPDRYRFEDTIGPEGVQIVCRTYVVCGETPCCYYVLPDCMAGYAHQTSEWAKRWVKERRKRVLKSSWKSFCYPDKRRALESYKARKKWQVAHARMALSRAEAALGELDSLIAFEGLALETFPHQCEGGEYVKGISWGEW